VDLITQSYALRANFLKGKLFSFLTSLKVLSLAWCLVSLLLIALVFFPLKSTGMYFFFFNCSLTLSRFLWLMTVKYLAMAFLTTYLITIAPIRYTLILDNFEDVLPPVTLRVLKLLNSFLYSSNPFKSSSSETVLNLKTLSFLSVISNPFAYDNCLFNFINKRSLQIKVRMFPILI